LATETLYILEIKIPDQDSKRVPIQGRVTIGSGNDVDISIGDYGLAPRHCVFKESNEILTVQNTGGEDAVTVGKQKLSHGKMYIVDKGDSVKAGEITFVIRTEDAEVHYVDEEGSTLAGTLAEEIEVDEDDEESMSMIAKLSGFFKRKPKNEDEEDEDDTGKIQVIDHTQDEEGEEDDSPAAKLVKASGAGLGKVKAKNIKVSPFLKSKRAGIIIRFIAFVMNLTIVYAVYLYALPLLKIEELFQSNYDLIMPFVDKALPMIQPHVPENILTMALSYTTFKILTIFVTLEVLSSMLFSCNLALFLLGVTGNGTFLGKRIKAVFRAIFSLVTSPLIITELPVLLKYRTLKEVLSHSQLEKRSNFLSIILGFTIAPVVIVAAFLWPLVNDPTLLKLPEFVEIAKTPIKKGKREKNYVGASTTLGFKVSLYKKPSLELLPSLEKTGLKLYIFDLKKGKKVSLSMAKAIDLNDEFKLMLEQNPFFSSYSPELFKFMNEQKDSPGVVREITNLTRDSLGITPNRLHEILLEHGPYINGIMAIRMKILNSLGINDKFKATFYQAGRAHYLMIDPESTGVTQNIYILPLGGMGITPFQFSFKTKDRSLANNFIENFFKKARTLKKGYEFDPVQVESWNDLSVLDFYAAKSSINEETASKIASFYEEKIGILKSPEGVSAKAKKVFASQLEKTLKRSSKELGDSPLSKKLETLLGQLPKTEVKK
tara:strand:- start:76661 stop:78808 length:2148 start_codon:yes stop_codon:yes gene_type:complete